MRQVCILTTLSESTIKRLMDLGLFPMWHRVTPGRRKAFYADEVDDWIANPPPFDHLPALSKARAASGRKKGPPSRKK
ncbi:helix-turn-helix transcriptional regulator [Sinorhizobium meliloti]|uniref:helix-turn-helix transcriptional regulator n=1 Tax=Rhizobium meliloti TaxID=382 RepID=UPI000FDA9BE0|nr:AlpA family phage regulatory protein [Sinorhizobium meliloti]RVG14946.1 AlpA family phage regulatory protein [Sinorhizobium meliloti]